MSWVNPVVVVIDILAIALFCFLIKTLRDIHKIKSR
jgi:hypothetical protein